MQQSCHLSVTKKVTHLLSIYIHLSSSTSVSFCAKINRSESAAHKGETWPYGEHIAKLKEDVAKEAADKKVAKVSESSSKEEGRKREESDPKKKLKNEEHTGVNKSYSSKNLHCDRHFNFCNDRIKDDSAKICLRGKKHPGRYGAAEIFCSESFKI